MLTPWSLQFHGLKKRIAWNLYQRRNLQSAHVLHATSRDEADGFRALGLTQPIAVIPNGVELPGEGGRGQSSEVRDQTEPPNHRSTEAPEHRTTEPPNHRTILFLSRIHPKKGLLDLVQAWQTVRPQGWRIVIAGGDEDGHLTQIKKEVGRHKLENQFTFLGEVRDEAKWDLYRSADLFVLPTKSENFGIVIAEALASGVPVITTKGTPWEELQTHHCGWWVEPTAAAVAGALREACGLSDEERSAMGQRGRKLIEDKYTWPAAAKQMLAVYRWMLGEAERPSCIQM
jgi:glycosyltransferase involved in cell wall biosynthesis